MLKGKVIGKVGCIRLVVDESIPANEVHFRDYHGDLVYKVIVSEQGAISDEGNIGRSEQ